MIGQCVGALTDGTFFDLSNAEARLIYLVEVFVHSETTSVLLWLLFLLLLLLFLAELGLEFSLLLFEVL